MEGGQPPTADAYKEQVAMEKKKLYKQLLVMVVLSFAVSGLFYLMLFKAIDIEKGSLEAGGSGPQSTTLI